jgi:hypothetical protein
MCTWASEAAAAPGSIYTWGTGFADTLRRVVPDAYGGLCMTGTFARGGDGDTSITTRRMTLGPGAMWSYDWGGPTFASHYPGAIVTSGTWVVVAGSCESAGTGNDQFIQVWKY